MTAELSELDIQSELYRVLKNVIGKGLTLAPIEFGDIRSAYHVDGGFADIVLFRREGPVQNAFVVIEMKRVGKQGRLEKRFDPYSPQVIDQAALYALKLSAPYFATCNGNALVLFETFKQGLALPERRARHYDLRMRITESFAKQFLEDVANTHAGKAKWQPLDEIFVDRLRTFHYFIMPYVLASLKEVLRADKEFEGTYQNWLKSQLFSVTNETNSRIAEQAAYLLMNKILFYKTLEAYRKRLPRMAPIATEDPEEFAIGLRVYFDHVLDINYKAIFQKGIFDEIPISKELIPIVNDFISEIDTYVLAKIKSDIIGRVYEHLIPPDERHRLGQYYTPPPVVELIVRATIQNSDSVVFDPGTGSGGFLIKSYHSLAEKKQWDNTEGIKHKQLLEQLWGVDINQFPAHLSAINLASQELSELSKNIHIAVSDFFKITPFRLQETDSESIPLRTTLVTLDGTNLGEFPSRFDVILSNPPYTDWREMEAREKIMKVATNYNGEKIEVGKQAGIYVYFLLHATKFLTETGRMGFIVSDAWLDLDYGVGLKRFLLDKFAIEAVISFDKGVFETALVNTTIIILQKKEGESQLKERLSNIFRFVRVKMSENIERNLSEIKKTQEFVDGDAIRVYPITQSQLSEETKWGVYLRAPAVYFDLVGSQKLVRLSQLAKCRIGIQTFADKFYILDEDTRKTWNVSHHNLMPIVTSPKEVPTMVIDSKSPERYHLLTVSSPLDQLDSGTRGYIEQAQRTRVKVRKKTGVTVEGFQNLPRVSQADRRPWYNIGKVDSAPIIFPYMMWGKTIFIWNRKGVLAHQNFIEIHPNNANDLECLLGVLNSSLTELCFSSQAHVYGGGVAKLKPDDV